MDNAQGHRLVGSAKLIGWDQWRFAAPAHHEFSTFPDGGPALEASWSHPTLNKAVALDNAAVGFIVVLISGSISCETESTLLVEA